MEVVERCSKRLKDCRIAQLGPAGDVPDNVIATRAVNGGTQERGNIVESTPSVDAQNSTNFTLIE